MSVLEGLRVPIVQAPLAAGPRRHVWQRLSVTSGGSGSSPPATSMGPV